MRLRNILRVIPLAGLVAAGSGLVTTPAHAASTVIVEFEGTATATPGVNVGLPNDFTVTFTSGAGLCTDVTAGLKKAAGTGPCTVNATVRLHGICGASSTVPRTTPGTAAGTATVHTHDGHTYDIDILVLTTAVTTFEAAGTAAKRSTPSQPAQRGEATASGSASTDLNPATGACTDPDPGGERGFNIIGVITIDTLL